MSDTSHEAINSADLAWRLNEVLASDSQRVCWVGAYIALSDELGKQALLLVKRNKIVFCDLTEELSCGLEANPQTGQPQSVITKHHTSLWNEPAGYMSQQAISTVTTTLDTNATSVELTTQPQGELDLDAYSALLSFLNCSKTQSTYLRRETYSRRIRNARTTLNQQLLPVKRLQQNSSNRVRSAARSAEEKAVKAGIGASLLMPAIVKFINPMTRRQ